MSDTSTKKAEPPFRLRTRRKGSPARRRRREVRSQAGDKPGRFRLRDEAGRFPISRLTLTIVLTNLFGLVSLMIGSLGVSQYRDGLIQAKLEGVRAQAQVIAAIMATAAAEDVNCGNAAADGEGGACDTQLDPQLVNTIFTRIWPNFEGRVRIFQTPDGYNGEVIEDPSSLLLQDRVLRADSFVVGELPDLEDEGGPNLVLWLGDHLVESFVNLIIDPGFKSRARAASLEEELTGAFLASGQQEYPGASSVRYDEEGQIVASVSVPIRKVQAVYGVVTAEIGGIEELVAEARAALLSFFWVALVVSLIISILLTTTIAGPIRKLAAAADKVRDGIRGTGKMRIPDFPRRRDEIGELSDSFRSMTQALYDRIETIDHFAADVSHELKNPLTSIRSAIETLDVARTDAQREKLLAVIKNDVARMDRLITDISNASRLDAELAREAREAVDMIRLLHDICDLYNTTRKDGAVPVRLLGRHGTQPLYVFGSPSTLGQIFRNLIDNAISFSPPGGVVRVTLTTDRDEELGPAVKISVADDGPGVPPENLNHIFDRFYTKRPAGTTFGNNSGLGLAICRQIAESHGGRIWAENRMSADGAASVGAVFIVVLPLRRQS